VTCPALTTETLGACAPTDGRRRPVLYVLIFAVMAIVLVVGVLMRGRRKR
jgi:hypothetical protein